MSDVRRLFRSLFFVWSCLSHLQKNIVQLITRSFLMIQSVSFTSAAFGGFCQGISMFFSICLNKKSAEVIKFFGILKNMSPRIKYIFVQERKAMFCLLKNLFLSFTQFSNLISLCYCYLKVRSLFSACIFKNMMNNYA